MDGGQFVGSCQSGKGVRFNLESDTNPQVNTEPRVFVARKSYCPPWIVADVCKGLKRRGKYSTTLRGFKGIIKYNNNIGCGVETEINWQRSSTQFH